MLSESQSAELLVEISYASAVNNLGSNKMRKAIRRYFAGDHKLDEFPPLSQAQVDKYIHDLQRRLLDVIPDDLEDNQKGLVVTWLARLVRNLETGYLEAFLFRPASIDSVPGPHPDAWGVIETFFHYQRFMRERDLNKIKDLSELAEIVNDANSAIRDYQEGRNYKDANAPGAQEVFRDDEEWKIVAIHNKGAACELGKGTHWCTAAPGLDYFEDYYKPDDPLFYFKNKKTGDRFQVHIGSDQYMDVDDRPVLPSVQYELLRLLGTSPAADKHPWLRYQHSYIAIDNVLGILYTQAQRASREQRLMPDAGSQAVIDKAKAQIPILNNELEKYITELEETWSKYGEPPTPSPNKLDISDYTFWNVSDQLGKSPFRSDLFRRLQKLGVRTSKADQISMGQLQEGTALERWRQIVLG